MPATWVHLNCCISEYCVLCVVCCVLCVACVVCVVYCVCCVLCVLCVVVCVVSLCVVCFVWCVLCCARCVLCVLSATHTHTLYCVSHTVSRWERKKRAHFTVLDYDNAVKPEPLTYHAVVHPGQYVLEHCPAEFEDEHNRHGVGPYFGRVCLFLLLFRADPNFWLFVSSAFL